MLKRILFPVLAVFLAGASTGHAEQDRTGKAIFDTHCSHCHNPGYEYPGTHQLAVTRGENMAVLEERDNLTADYVKYIVRNGLNAMPPFKPTNITDRELDALADYLGK